MGILVCGLNGSGKSTLGRALAAALRLRFLDSEDLCFPDGRFDAPRTREEFLAALDAAGLTDRVDAIHLDDLSRLTMDYAGRFSVEMEYNADYDRMLQILEAGISKLESNQTGSIRLDLNPPILTLD